MKMKTLMKSACLLLASAGVAYAEQEPDYIYFLDHEYLKPGQSITVNYKFPSEHYYIDCHQDGPGSNLGSVEYKYKNNIFKAQMAADQDPRYIHFVIGGKYTDYREGIDVQSIDESGTLTFVNLDDSHIQGEGSELGVTCSYEKIGKSQKNR